tara:strand:- start:392 stop:544 length:153 start_codon:yes stop_codon:yes gene_type:complete
MHKEQGSNPPTYSKEKAKTSAKVERPAIIKEGMANKELFLLTMARGSFSY